MVSGQRCSLSCLMTTFQGMNWCTQKRIFSTARTAYVTVEMAFLCASLMSSVYHLLTGNTAHESML